MEIMVASTISIIVLTSFMAVFIHGLKLWQQEEIKNELNFNLEEAMEKIRIDLRLSSIGVGLMAFYSATNGEYNAISIPLSTDTDGDSLMERDDNDKLVWNQTVIYHVRPGTPDKLMRTVFAPRYTNATPASIYAQLSSVVAATSDAAVASAAMSGEACDSKVVFENLVQLTFRAPSATYDCYNPTLVKGETFTWGSLVLSSGTHQVTFTVTNKNAASSAYKLIVDDLRLSASASTRDGELYSPTNSHPASPYFSGSGGIGSVSGQTMGPEWSGQSALICSGTATGAVTFNVANDLWVDNNFNSPSYMSASNCSVLVNTNFVPADVVVSSDKGTAWSAFDCGDSASATTMPEIVTVTNFLYATTNTYTGVLKKSGCWARFFFSRGTNPVEYSCLISNAAIYTEDGSVFSNITFNGGRNFVMMYPESAETTNSDWVPMWSIDKGSNYMVKFQTAIVGDRTYDLLLGERGGTYQIAYYPNAGSRFAPSYPGSAALLTFSSLPAPYFVDIDGDGDYDMFEAGGIVGGSGGAHWYRNDGVSRGANMTYMGHPFNWCGCSESKMCLGDIDGDGDFDILYSHPWDTQILLVRNGGTVRSPTWPGASVLVGGIAGTYPSPELADIDGDGDLDLFSGSATDGNLYFWRNNGTTTVPAFNFVTTAYLTNPPALTRGTPRFFDLDADGLKDLVMGGGDGTGTLIDNGKVLWYRNIGTVANAAWDAPVLLATGAGQYSAPSFVDINAPSGANGNGPAHWLNSDGTTFSSVNGANYPSVIGLSSVEVGYPRFAKFLSGVFDTANAAPAYNKLYWTKGTNNVAANDVYVRVRTSSLKDMSDVTDADWLPSSATYFTVNTDNSLAGLPHLRYLQYEALLECGKGTNTWAHTNNTPPILRDVTIDWPAAAGLVDLQVDFGRGPDCGIVDVTVDGQALVKALEGEMKIYKEGRTGTNYATGILEVRPLNTGK